MFDLEQWVHVIEGDLVELEYNCSVLQGRQEQLGTDSVLQEFDMVWSDLSFESLN